MPRAQYHRRFLPDLLTFVVAFTACGGSNPLGPDSQMNVTKADDQFLIQVRFMENGTDNLTYRWRNTGTQASIDISQSISSGSVILIIKDHAGTVVHQGDISNDDDTDTAAGVAGDWTIEIRILNATGTFDIAVQKKI